ncbi:hypothetical protein [Vineibacter terrae]|uniref:hypothetical protein n=1 Tax=Vineibacter terrae TaxID=2586908 RepID=UPI002E2F49E8|nr:hypothetical protein [Vineibacter terrae]HEX2888221.1 hypothetical protein [Vineibacter terrae]
MSVPPLRAATIGPQLDDVIDAIAGASWFAAAGEPLTMSDRDEAARYVQALRLGAVRVAAARDWHDAARVAQDARWSRGWWDSEEQQRQALMLDAERAYGRHELMTALSTVMRTAGDLVHGKAALAAARAGVAEPALIRAAAGAASMACHQLALAALDAAAQDHPFRLKFRLFAAGRWPLCVIEESLYVL